MKNIFALFCAVVFLTLPGAVWAAGTLNVFIWSEYIDPAVIEAFEKKYDVEVKISTYESNEDMVAKLQTPGGDQYDIIVPSTYFMTSLKALNLIQPLNHEKLPNLKNLDPIFTEITADPGNKYSVPYQWGTTGLVVRHKDMSKVKPSWALLFDPKSSLGSIVIMDTARDSIGAALMYLGYSINSTDMKEIKEATELLIATKARSDFRSFSGGVGGVNEVMSSVAAVAHTYSGDAMKAQVEDPDVHYFNPEEGSEMWIDLLAVPRKAPNLENAHLFLNYLLEPEVAAELAISNQCATPNLAAKAFISEADLKNPALYPTPEQMKKLQYLEDLGSNNRIYDEAWTRIK